MELAGIKNILTKSLKSKNTITVARATMDGLRLLRSPDQIGKKRDIREEEGLWQ
jgi:small subunit ribosomal protein S5